MCLCMGVKLIYTTIHFYTITSPGQVGGTPLPTTQNQDGSMPLAFTQKDFLVDPTTDETPVLCEEEIIIIVYN